MTYVKTNVGKKHAAGKGAARKAKVFLCALEDIEENGYVRSGNIVTALNFKPGKYGIEIYADQKSIKTPTESTGEFNATSILQTVDFLHTGDHIDIRDCRSNWLNVESMIVIDYCDGTTPKIYGSLCSALGLEFKGEEDFEKTNSNFIFKSTLPGPDVADFTGTVTLDTVKGTAAADAATIDVAAGKGEYQLTSGASSAIPITALTNPVDGGVYSLLGSGGTHPSTIAAAGNFLLKNGTTWTALAGSKITFKAFKDGASSYKFIEVSRV